MIDQAILAGYALLVAVLTGYLAWFSAAALRECRHKAATAAYALRPEDRVSLIIPASNEEALLGECLDSVLAQDLSHVDAVIIAVNGCLDKTEKIVDRYARRCPLIAKIVLEKSSKVNAILAAMRHAPSRHVVLLDADMVFEKSALKRLLRFHFGSDHLVSSCLIDPLTRDTTVARLISCDRLFRGRILNPARNTRGMANVPGNLFVVDKVLYRTLMQRETLLEDNEFTYQLWQRGQGVMYLPEVLACERERLTLTNLVLQRKRWVLGNIDTFQSYASALVRLPGDKRAIGFSYPLLWYIVHYALAAGSLLGWFDSGWRAAYLILALAYASSVALSFRLRPTRRTRRFTVPDAVAHALVFPWAVTLATLLAVLHLCRHTQAFRHEVNRDSFVRDGLAAAARI